MLNPLGKLVRTHTHKFNGTKKVGTGPLGCPRVSVERVVAVDACHKSPPASVDMGLLGSEKLGQANGPDQAITEY